MTDLEQSQPSAEPVTAAGNPASEADLLVREAWALRRSDPKQALALGKKAHALVESANDLSVKAYSLLVMGYGHTRLSDLNSALHNTQAALTLFESLEDKEGKRKALNTLGIIYGESGDLPKTLKIFLNLQTLCAELGDTKAEADALNNLGISYRYLGELDSALDHYLRALELFQDSGSKDGEGYTLVNLGLVYQELGRYQEALDYFSKSLNTGETPDAYTHALVLNNIGRTYQKLKDAPKALEYSKESLTMMEQLGDRLGASYTLDDLGLTYLQMGELIEAARCFKESLAVKEEVGDKKGEAETRIHLGHLYTRQGTPDLAIDSLMAGLDKAREIAAKPEIYKAHEALAEAYKQNRQFGEACEHLENYVAAKAEVFNEATDSRLQGLRVQFEVEQAKKQKEIYRLKNVELTEAVNTLHALTASLKEANEDKGPLLERLARQVNEDALTGLYNRRYIDQKLAQEFERSKRVGTTMSVMLCDLDNFKQVNDRFSHQIGDKILVQVAEILHLKIRQVDTVARYGGEEFIVLLPETEPAAAARIGKRIRKAVEAHPWEAIAPELAVTISIGVAGDKTLTNYEKLVSLADDKLYRAKRSGKNKVVV